LNEGHKKVVAFDVVRQPEDAIKDPRVEYVLGDIRNKESVFAICKGADCVWHNAAAVGPFHPKHTYEEVNHQGTLHVIGACKFHKVPKIVMSSSPSTRFTGVDVDGLREDELPDLPLQSYLQEYAASKARGELALRQANCDSMMTIAVAPHQVYGPRDNLLLPNFLEAAETGRLRVMGSGQNRICFTHVDNYCHGLILGEAALYRGSVANGEFYIVTDGDTHPYPEGYALFYDALDEAAVGLGFDSIKAKMRIPFWLIWLIGQICGVLSAITGTYFKLNPFTVKMSTMHRWFRIDNAVRDLKYKPIKSFTKEWPNTIEWFRTHWYPKYLAQKQGASGLAGIALQSQERADLQAAGVTKMQK